MGIIDACQNLQSDFEVSDSMSLNSGVEITFDFHKWLIVFGPVLCL